MVLPFLTALSTKLKMKSISDLIIVMQITLNVQDPEVMHAWSTAQHNIIHHIIIIMLSDFVVY